MSGTEKRALSVWEHAGRCADGRYAVCGAEKAYGVNLRRCAVCGTENAFGVDLGRYGVDLERLLQLNKVRYPPTAALCDARYPPTDTLCY
eukprot:2601915-Rhodomonas_salina.3